jgi:hypothetical protein
VKLTFTLDLPRGLAEQLTARAIREGKNLGQPMFLAARDSRQRLARTAAERVLGERWWAPSRQLVYA